MKTFFVTGTGTGVGKTYVTASLVRALRAQGRNVDAIKPVVSGFDEASPEGSDPAVLLDALSEPLTPAALARVSLFRFRAPLSPDMAAAREGRTLSLEPLVRFCGKAMARPVDVLFIEGVGGAFVPLSERETVADWISALDVPALVVAGSYLGTLSHTLATVKALRACRVTVHGVVVSESLESPCPLEETRATLGRFLDVPITLLTRGGALDPAQVVGAP